MYYVSTGVKVLKSEWRIDRIVDRPDADELNDRLDIISRAVATEVNDRLQCNQPVDVADIRRAIWSCRKYDNANAGTPFLDWYEEQILLLDLRPGTIKHYKTTLSRLRACGIITRWEDLTVEKVYEFDAWLHQLKVPLTDAEKKQGVQARFISDSGVYTYHKNLMGLISRAVKVGRVQSSPYERLRGEFKRGVKESVEYLTEEEVEAFVDLHPMPGTMAAVSRDLFVFQLFTGLSYSDAQAFDIRNYKHVDGRWVSVGARIKTGEPFVSQLLPPVVEVLERYNWQVPKIQNGEYNQCLKSLGMAAGITTKMHSHLARHTFATWMLRHGVKIENLARMLGHKKIEQTLRYAKVVAQSVHDDFDKIAELLNNKTNNK